jgi:hypothetical protein
MPRIVRDLSVLILTAAIISGCTSVSEVKQTGKKIAREVTFSKSDMKKKIGVSLFQNRTFIADQRVVMVFQRQLAQSIQDACPDVLLITPESPEYPDVLVSLPRTASGRVDNIDLALAGQRLGMNAIVTGELVSLTGHYDDDGLLWLKKDQHVARLLVGIEVYDTHTAAKVLSENFAHEFDIDEAEAVSINARKMDEISYFEDEIKKAGGDLGRRICYALEALKWKGYVVSVSGNKIFVSAGWRSGIKVGDIFEVYTRGKQIQGAQRYRYLLPGTKYGEIKITNVFDDRAEAVHIDGDPVAEGSSIRPKR